MTNQVLTTNNKFSQFETDFLLTSYIAAAKKLSFESKVKTKTRMQFARDVGEMRSELISRGFKNRDIEWMRAGMEVVYEYAGTRFGTIVSINKSLGWVIVKLDRDMFPIKVEDINNLSIRYI